MSIGDRLRAKEPPEGDERWNRCSIKELGDEKALVIDEGEEIELKLTPELMDLFKSRMDGKSAWYIKKSS